MSINTHTHIYISPSVYGYLGCFHVLAIVDSAAMNKGEGCVYLFLVPRPGVKLELQLQPQPPKI